MEQENGTTMGINNWNNNNVSHEQKNEQQQLEQQKNKWNIKMKQQGQIND